MLFGAWTSTVSPTFLPISAVPSGEEGDVFPEPPRPEIQTSIRPPFPSSITTPRADPDDVGTAALDDLRVLDPRAQDGDLALEQSLLVLRGVVLEVLGEVAVPARDGDRLDDLLAARGPSSSASSAASWAC